MSLDCEGERERAIELMDSELEKEKAEHWMRAWGMIMTRLGLGTALVVFAWPYLRVRPMWAGWVLVGSVLLFVGYMSSVEQRRGREWDKNLERRRAAQLAMIEARHRECVGGEEE